MDINSLKVVSIIQNKYLYKVYKIKKHKLNLVLSVGVFVLCICSIFGLKTINNNYTSDIVSAVTYITNPINPLYSDMGDIVFTSSGGVVLLNNKSNNFNVPVTYSSYKVENGVAEFTPASPLLCSIEQGVVEDIYIIGNNIKCIKIKHSRSVYSVIENVDILGVHIGALVSKGQKLGTVNLNSSIKLCIYVNGEAKNISINGNNVCVN